MGTKKLNRYKEKPIDPSVIHTICEYLVSID